MIRFAIANESKAALPQAAFRRIAEAALGFDGRGKPRPYSLTLAIVPPRRMKKLNLIYRNKNEPTDILSFPLSEAEGEIYICPSETRRMRKEFDRSYENFFVFLFIHGCVHLIGHDHVAIMESIEARLRKQFKI